MVLTTDVVVNEKPEKENGQMAGMPHGGPGGMPGMM
jgi:hypothetical protein